MTDSLMAVLMSASIVDYSKGLVSFQSYQQFLNVS